MKEVRDNENTQESTRHRKVLADTGEGVSEIAASDSQYLPDLLLINGLIPGGVVNMSEHDHLRPRDDGNWNFTTLYSAGIQVSPRAIFHEQFPTIIDFVTFPWRRTLLTVLGIERQHIIMVVVTSLDMKKQASTSVKQKTGMLNHNNISKHYESSKQPVTFVCSLWVGLEILERPCTSGQ